MNEWSVYHMDHVHWFFRSKNRFLRNEIYVNRSSKKLNEPQTNSTPKGELGRIRLNQTIFQMHMETRTHCPKQLATATQKIRMTESCMLVAHTAIGFHLLGFLWCAKKKKTKHRPKWMNVDRNIAKWNYKNKGWICHSKMENTLCEHLWIATYNRYVPAIWFR